MIKKIFIIIFLQFFSCMFFFTYAKAETNQAALFPPKYDVIFKGAVENDFIDIANIAIKDENGKEMKKLIASLNASGGIPFSNENGNFLRHKFSAAQLDGDYNITNISKIVPNRDSWILDIEGNGSRYLMFWHNTSPVSGSVTIWRKTGDAWKMVFITKGDPVKIKKIGNDILFVFGDCCTYSRALFSAKTKTFTGLGFINTAQGADGIFTIIPEDIIPEDPVEIKVTKKWLSLDLYSSNEADAKILFKAKLNSPVWKLATRGDWILVLGLYPDDMKWGAAYTGKSWRPCWMKKNK